MKSVVLKCLSLVPITFLWIHISLGQITGPYTVPGTVNGSTVNNLTQLAAVLNSGTVSGTAIFEFTSSYTTTGEVFPVVFNAYGGSGNVIIRPAASVSTPLVTSGAPSSQGLISLNGVRNLTIDGRPGGVGTVQHWQFTNTASSGSYPVFLFINGAQYDALKYLNVQGSPVNTSGNINFSTSSTGGNSYDTIAYCNITSHSAGYAYIQIYSSGTSGNLNSNNNILNNNISNFRAFNGSGMPTQGGIIIGTTGNGSNWNISGNSIYCTGAPYVYGAPIGAISFGPGSASTDNIISGNYIGGQQPLCGGGMMKILSYQANGYPDFDAIYNNSGSVSVTRNVIKNIYMGSSTGSSTFCGINISGSGTADVSHNIVGSPTDTNNIVSGINGTMLGIYNHSSGGAVTIDSNIVANLTSNYRAFISGSNQTPGAITGIYDYGGSGGNIGATSITNNQVFNLTCASNYNNNLYFYINTSGSGANYPSSTYNNPQNNVVCGIFMEQDNTNSNTQLISKNTIYGLNCTIVGGSNIAYISGIVANGNTGGTNIINGNLIYGNYALNTFGSSGQYFIGLNGIHIPTNKAGKYFIQDNIIDLGYRSTDGSSVQNAMIYGIWDNNAINSANLKEYIYHNSVYIGGSDNTALYSYAMARNLNYSTPGAYDSLTVMNNIFVNNRTSTNASSKAYGIYLNAKKDVLDDYNDVYGTGAHFYYGGTSTVGYLTQATYQTADTGNALHNINVDPQYVSPTTATPNLHITTPSPIEQAGTPAYTIAYDFDSLLRATYTPVDLGATVGCSGSPATVSLVASDDTICAGTSVTFTATAVNGGTPVYTFYLNGASVQSGSSNTFTTSSLANNDSVKVKIDGNSPCASVNTAFSSSLKTIVNPAGATPTISIGASQTSICAGANVTFTATNGGTAPTYNFYRNGTPVQNGASNTYSSSTLTNNDSVWVILTSNAACVSPATVTSTKVHMTVTAAVTPTVSVSASLNNICAGTSVTFTATYTNGGGAPTFNFIKNGVSVQSGTNAAYTTTALSNNDSVWVVMTSNAACATATTATSTKVHMVINSPATPTASISASQNNVCAGTSITFTASSTNGGTPSYNFYRNGTSVQSGAVNTYTTNTLANNDSVWVVLTSTASCVSPTTATSSKVYIVITGAVTPTVTLSASQNNVCPGTQINFTAAGTNGGTSPTYRFYVNGISVQNTTSNNYSSSTLTNGNTIQVVMTSNTTCRSIDSAVSNTVTMVITSAVTPAVTISPSVNNICAGTSVTFTATATGGGSSPVYNFYVNGASVQNGAGNTYSSSALQNNDSLWVVLTSNAACASPLTATSSKVKMIVNPSVTPTVSLAVSQNNICPGTSVTFTASGNNGGTPTYSFYVNGVLVQNTTAATYSSSTLTNGNTVKVVMMSTASCRSIDSAVSTTITMVVSGSVTPTVTVFPSANSICPNTSITFTASGTGGGTSPTYNFFVNGTSVQNGAGTTYTTSNIHNNDSVWVVITSNAACASPTTGTSTKAHMVVVAATVPSVTIAASQNNLCTGTSITFTAATTNGGSGPVFNFYVNGVSVQSGTQASYTSTAIQNNDSVWVVITSNAACVSPATATSTKVRMVINASVTPTVILTPSQNNICPGTSVTFTAASTNGGAAPIYRFYVNGVSVQSSSSTNYSSSTITNGNTIKVVVLSNAACRSIDSAVSNVVTMVVSSSVAPTVSISPSANNICAGTSVTFSNTAGGGGAAPTFNFFVNGTSVQNGTGSSFTSSNIHNNDSVWVVMTSNSACASPNTATSSKAHMIVIAAVTPSVTMSASQSNICAGTQVTFTASGTNGGAAPQYNFFKNGTSVQNGAQTTYSSAALNNNDSVWVVITSNAPCAAPATAQSTKVRITVGTPVAPTVAVTASQNNVCAGTNITFTATGTNGGAAPQYNFFVNGVSVQNGSQASYSSATLHNSDSVWVVMTSNAACVSPSGVTSTKVRVAIIPSIIPSILINPITNPACAGEAVNFTVSATNGGVTPNFEFLANGISVQNGSAIFFSRSNLTDGSIIKVILTSSATCASPITVSDTASVTILPASASSIVGSVCAGGSYQFGSRTLTLAGTYRDTLTSANGCDSIITLQLSVNALAASQITDSFCVGSSYIFHGHSLSTAGVYRDTLTAASGCDSIVTLNLSVASSPSAIIAQVGRDSLATTPFATYQWLLNGAPIAGATSELYVATHSGQYTVIVTNGAGCKDTSAVFTYTMIGIDELGDNVYVQLYPNPTSGEINIRWQGAAQGDATIRVYDLQGQVISTSVFASGHNNVNTIDLSKYAAGMYYLQLQGQGWRAMRKVEVVK